MTRFTRAVQSASNVTSQMSAGLSSRAVCDQYLVPILKPVSFSSGLRGVHTEKEQLFLQGSSRLPVHGLLLLQSVPDTAQGHEDDDDPKEHHLGGNVLRGKAQLCGTDAS